MAVIAICRRLLAVVFGDVTEETVVVLCWVTRRPERVVVVTFAGLVEDALTIGEACEV